MFIINVFYNFSSFFFFFLKKKKKIICNKKKISNKKIKYSIFLFSYKLFFNLFKSIFYAKKNIFFQFYIFKKDFIGKKILNLLLYKSLYCYVFLLIDKIGSIKLNFFIKKFLILYFNNNKILLNVRNHKKIVLIDNNILWIGGNNIGIEYLGLNLIIGDWNDFHCKITNFYYSYINKNLFFKNNFLIKKKIFSKNNFYFENNIFNIFSFFKKKIKYNLIVISPYLIIDLQLVKIINNIKINITIYLSFKTDNIYIQNTSIIFLKFLKKKIKIYLLYYGFFHKKIFIFDKKYFLFGSSNFDIRSNYFNKENVFIIKNLLFINFFLNEMKKKIIYKIFINYKKKNFYIKFFYIISFLNYFLK
ncbi:MAG: phospholipase D-like domain-containing protein [Candidatus Carsonella ruddii]